MREGKPKTLASAQVYIDLQKLLNVIVDVVPMIPKEYRLTIGAEMQRLAVLCIGHVAAAFLNRNKLTRLQKLIDFQTDYETLKTLIRLAGDRKWIQGLSKFAEIIELEDEIGRQTSAWKNSVVKAAEQPVQGD